MATIKEAIDEIENFQGQNIEQGPETQFKTDLFNFTTSLCFDYLAHGILDSRRAMLNTNEATSAEKEYYRLFGIKSVLDEYIRINSIGHLFHLWNILESYLRISAAQFGIPVHHKISNVYNELAAHRTIPPVLREEFEVIRQTRNCFHNGGAYNTTFPKWSGILNGVQYDFVPGQHATPLRILDVVHAMWRQYKAIEAF